MTIFTESKLRAEPPQVIRPHIAALVLLTLLLAGCWGSGLKSPDVKINTSPKERYQIGLTIENSHDVIDEVSGRVQFHIKNRECMPLSDPIAGITPDDIFNQNFEFKKIKDNKFVGYIFIDAALNEDYYGKGVCQWEVVSVRALVRQNGVTQHASISANKILSEGEQMNWCRFSTTSPNMEDVCSSSSDERIIERESKVGYSAALASRKI